MLLPELGRHHFGRGELNELLRPFHQVFSAHVATTKEAGVARRILRYASLEGL